ncbi:MAG: hypothetical protein ACBZ72_04580 [Candidatus Bathyarchaeia archaeon]|jgi:hypothetical protein
METPEEFADRLLINILKAKHQQPSEQKQSLENAAEKRDPFDVAYEKAFNKAGTFTKAKPKQTTENLDPFDAAVKAKFCRETSC